MNTKRAALPHQTIQQQRRILGQLVVLDEQLLEFVNHEQDQALLTDPKSQETAAQAIFRGIAQFFAAREKEAR